MMTQWHQSSWQKAAGDIVPFVCAYLLPEVEFGNTEVEMVTQDV